MLVLENLKLWNLQILKKLFLMELQYILLFQFCWTNINKLKILNNKKNTLIKAYNELRSLIIDVILLV
jgi:hypothetical protein